MEAELNDLTPRVLATEQSLTAAIRRAVSRRDGDVRKLLTDSQWALYLQYKAALSDELRENFNVIHLE